MQAHEGDPDISLQIALAPHGEGIQGVTSAVTGPLKKLKIITFFLNIHMLLF